MQQNTKPVDTGTSGPGSLTVVIGRLVWMLVGPMVLAAITYNIVTRGVGWLTVWDATYGIVVLLTIAGRWVEMRSGSALTATGEPATIEHFKRYLVILLVVAAVVWVVANALGNHLLR